MKSEKFIYLIQLRLLNEAKRQNIMLGCKNNGIGHKVIDVESTSTLMGWSPFYDNKGHYHKHDPNIHTAYYSCSNMHSWFIETKNKCWCQDRD